MMAWFHPIGQLLGEIDWLLDAPDADHAFMGIDLGLEAAKLASFLKAKFNALDRSPNLDDARANEVEIDNQAVISLHVSKLLRKADGSRFTGLAVHLFFLHFVSFR